MASFSLAAASVHVRAVSMCRRALNVTLRAYSTQQFLARAQPLFAVTTPMAVHCNAFSALASTGGTPSMAVVKVGTGQYRELSLEHHKILNVSVTAFLDALATSHAFATKLQNVPLDECKVWVLPPIAGKLPTPDEEQAAHELLATDIIQAPPAGANLVVRVTLSNHASKGTSNVLRTPNYSV
jgi:hypothetical protein